MIDGFKLTMTGQELRKHLGERVGAYQRKAERLRKQLKEPDPDCPLPEEMLQNEIERAEDRAEGFEFLREHTVELEVYLLGKADLQFAEFLPEEEEDDFMPCYMYRR